MFCSAFTDKDTECRLSGALVLTYQLRLDRVASSELLTARYGASSGSRFRCAKSKHPQRTGPRLLRRAVNLPHEEGGRAGFTLICKVLFSKYNYHSCLPFPLGVNASNLEPSMAQYWPSHSLTMPGIFFGLNPFSIHSYKVARHSLWPRSQQLILSTTN